MAAAVGGHLRPNRRVLGRTGGDLFAPTFQRLFVQRKPTLPRQCGMRESLPAATAVRVARCMLNLASWSDIPAEYSILHRLLIDAVSVDL